MAQVLQPLVVESQAGPEEVSRPAPEERAEAGRLPTTSSETSGASGEPWEEIDLAPAVAEASAKAQLPGSHPPLDKQALQEMITRAAHVIGAVRYPDDLEARRAFERHYVALVGGVCEWVGWDEVGFMLMDGRQLPAWLRTTIGVLAFAGGAFFIGPEGLQLPRRRPAAEAAGAPAQVNERRETRGEVEPGTVGIDGLDALLASAQ